ncbi:MAG TPA: hypothetical protein VK722_07465 [Candidatus Aquilonibacter sp.]|jgi:hypothetical protein|nr:hypothetical protein [Candidatus Aquilonibacter sp.]
MRFAFRPFAVFLLTAFFATSSVAQQPQSPDSATPPAQSAPPGTAAPQKDAGTNSSTSTSSTQNKDDQTAGTQKKNAGTSNDRLFLALPNFLTLENSANVPPLTTGEKFKVVARGSFDKIQFPWYALLAGLSQAENSEPGYGQGWEGYGKRYASAFADGTIENFMTSAVLPSILHQDPRFYQSSEGSVTHRAGYAISRIFITRSDSGHKQFNYSEILGSALSAGISTNTYHPRGFVTAHFDPSTNMVVYQHQASDRTLPNTLSVWGTQVGYDTITIVIKEFWPDIHRKIVHKHQSEAVQAGSGNQ